MMQLSAQQNASFVYTINATGRYRYVNGKFRI